MEERLEYQSYLLKGELETLKFDYHSEHRKIEYANQRREWCLTRLRISGGLFLLSIILEIGVKYIIEYIEKVNFVILKGLEGIFVCVMFFLVISIMSWLGKFLLDVKVYIQNGDNWFARKFPLKFPEISASKEKQMAEEKVFSITQKMMKLEFQIEKLDRQIWEKQQEQKKNLAKSTEMKIDEDSNDVKIINKVNEKTAEEIHTQIYYLEQMEQNLQARYENEYSKNQLIKARSQGDDQYIKKCLMLYIVGFAGILLSFMIKALNLHSFDNSIIRYAVSVLGIGSFVILILAASFILGKELLLRYVNSKKFIGKEYVDKIKEVSVSAEQIENEKELVEISQKISRIQLEKEKLEQLLEEKKAKEQEFFAI